MNIRLILFRLEISISENSVLLKLDNYGSHGKYFYFFYLDDKRIFLKLILFKFIKNIKVRRIKKNFK